MATTISNPPYNMKWQHPFFAQMWKQVMVHYNNEENRYLMELKDIMLNKLFQ